jgi:hypothetical protein
MGVIVDAVGRMIVLSKIIEMNEDKKKNKIKSTGISHQL